MIVTVCFSGEGFPTLGTRKGLHSSVDQMVSFEVHSESERLSTLRTRVGLFPCVRSLVPSELLSFSEGFLTLRTGEGLRVDFLVSSEL